MPKTLIRLGEHELLFEKRDLWVGVYWNTRGPGWLYQRLDLYICVIPMLPLHLVFYWKQYKEQE